MNVYIPLFQFINEKIDEKITILTPNRRLSATLQKDFCQFQQNLGNQVWSTLDILPIDRYLERLWETLIFSAPDESYPHLLKNEEVQFLWEAMLQDEANTLPALIEIQKTAKSLHTAWQLVHEWEINIDDSIFQTTEDYAVFQRLAQQLMLRYTNENWIDYTLLKAYLRDHINIHDQSISTHLILVGFTEESPALNNFLSRFKNATRFTVKEKSADSSTIQRLAFNTAEDEIRAMASFAKAISHHDSQARIGCVVTTLSRDRDRVQHIFQEVFHEAPQNKQITEVNISAGKSLITYPIIYLALQLIHLQNRSTSKNHFRYIITSPYLGNSSKEFSERQLLSNHLLKEKMQFFSPTFQLSKTKLFTPLLNEQLTHFYTQEMTNDIKPCSEWASEFYENLTVLGYPGERQLNSEEFQLIQALLNLLNRFAELDRVTKKIDINKAYNLFSHLAKTQIFQPQSPEANIQVLGILEASGLPFDYIWISGMDNENWPSDSHPNPFIPKSIQRQLQMPHASAKREWNFCQKIFTDLKNLSSNIVVSHAEKGEEENLEPSKMIQEHPILSLEALDLKIPISLAEQLFNNRILETIIDTQGEPLLPDEKIKGGINIIKNQALCPFKAYSTARLQIKEMDEKGIGLSPADRGNIIHAILAKIWSTLITHQQLISLDQEVLSKIIWEKINEIFVESKNKYTNTHLPDCYLQQEKERFHQLILDWLVAEKSRPPFTVIATEKEETISINEITLSMRIDRIDELENGRKLIVDYKTGSSCNKKHWFSDRPEEPQLPIYAIIDKSRIEGISFAQITSTKKGFIGYSENDLHIKGIHQYTDNWDAQLVLWKTTLEKLAEEFKKGLALANPKNGETTCRYCQLQPLCRIDDQVEVI